MSEENIAPVTTSTPESNVEVVTNWSDSLSDEYRNDPAVKDIPDVNTLFKRFKDTQSLVGGSLRPPTQDAGQEEITAFANRLLENEYLGLIRKPDSEDPTSYDAIYNSLGRPEDASGYEAGEGVDAQVFGAMANKAHELGLTKRQYEEMSQAHAALANTQMQEVESKRKQGIEQLQGEWAGAFNEKTTRVGQMIKQLGGHEGLEGALANNQIDAATLRLLDTIATQIGAEGTPLAQQLNQVTQMTSDELKQRRDEVTNRLIKENLSAEQRKALQDKMISLSEEISAHQ